MLLMPIQFYNLQLIGLSKQHTFNAYTVLQFTDNKAKKQHAFNGYTVLQFTVNKAK